MNHDNKFAAPGGNVIGSTTGGMNHQYGYENSSYDPATKTTAMDYGADQDTYGSIADNNHISIADTAHAVDAVEPHKWGYQNNNPDAKYHYGHHVTDATKNRGHGPHPDADYHGFGADDWRYSLRHSGCLWEVKDFSYSSSTYAVQHSLVHSTGSAKVHWVHVFNAHIYPDTANKVDSFKIVMANPVYEGLGYLNFVSTFGDTAIAAVGTFTHDPFASTYAKSARYSEAKGKWTLTATADSWKLVADTAKPKFAAAGADAGGVAISSFPHNQLGADFRFNLRTLHEFGHGFQDSIDANAPNKADSYFWYAVDKITVTFPHFVSATDSCHGLRSGHVADPSSVDCTDHVHSIIIDENHITKDSTAGRLTASVAETCDGYGPDKTTNHKCAWFCKNTQLTCGRVLVIDNIMSTYDEFHLRQYGTIQEIWAQLQYAYTETIDQTDGAETGFESPFPNVFFSAAQVSSIVLSCPNADEKCVGYLRKENTPYAGEAKEADRWTKTANDIENGLSRGDAFWVNNNDNAGR